MTLREALASEVHEQWSHWMAYMISLGRVEGFDFKIPVKHVARWKRQMRTPWDVLPDEEQESDLEMADRILGILERESVIAD